MVLRTIALCIKKSIRTIDSAARHGGEEISIILPETGKAGAFQIGERIRRNVEDVAIQHNERPVKVTVSIGCATYPFDADMAMGLVNCADEALYYSKQNGRNRISMYTMK